MNVYDYLAHHKSGNACESKMATRVENFCTEEASKESKRRDRVFSQQFIANKIQIFIWITNKQTSNVNKLKCCSAMLWC